MRILDVAPAPHFPPVKGGAIRVYNLLRRLSCNHEVRQFTAARTDRWSLRISIEALQIAPSYRQYRYHHPVEKLLHSFDLGSFHMRSVLCGAALRFCRPSCLHGLLDWADVVLIEYPWQFDYCYRLLPKARFVLASHNVEIQAFTSSAEAVGVGVKNNRWLRYIETMEKNAVARADLILAVSPEDRGEFVRRYGADPARIVVIPNGADTEQLVPADRRARALRKRVLSLPDKPTVIFVNSQAHPPGRPAFQWIKRLAEKSDGFTFLVAGSICSRPDVRGNLVITGPVDDIAPYFQAADIAVCPVQYGGGTKIKLIESMTSGLPTVAFSESLYGIACRDGEHLLVVEKSEQALLSALHRLADDSELADRLGRAAREFAVRHHDWEKIAGKLESVLLELLHSGSRTATAETASCTG